MNNYNFPYKVIYTNRKSICLQIIKGEVSIKAPLNLPINRINQVLDSKLNWIIKKQNEYRLKSKLSSSLFLNTPCRIWLKGRQYTVVDESSQTTYAIGENEIKYNSNLISINQIYHNECWEYINESISNWSKIINLHPSTIQIKNLKSKWGSCNSKGVIIINVKLIKAPKDVIDYVIIHELIHLKHMNHSKEFWDEVSKYCPRYKEFRSWLNVYGENLINCPSETKK